jgi:glyoxylase-like metal-dependent hydrolase (beta-lactamase superfamily II)
VALVDPAWNIAGLLSHVEKQGLTPVAVLVTHYHPDHVGGRMGGRVEGLAELMAQKPLPVYVNRQEAWGVKRVTGLSDSDLVQVDSGDRLQVGEIDVEFVHTPGHTPGSQCFRVRDALVSGDTLFIQGCGRVDLPGSDPDQMYESLRKLAALPDETILLPGHNYSDESQATLGELRNINPYLRVSDLAAWRRLMGA